MTFVRVENVGDWNVLLLHRFDNLIRLGLFDARIVLALSDE